MKQMKLVRQLCLYKYSRWLPWRKFIILKVRRIWGKKKRFRLVFYSKVSKYCWSWSSNTLATWCEEPTLWKRPWCWERSMAGREGGDWGWYGWMASWTQWTWVWANPNVVMDREAWCVEVQHFGHLMQRANSLEKTLMLGKIEGRGRRGQQRTRW